jgi:hypothetical protein
MATRTLDVQGALQKMMDVDGAIGATIVDFESGVTLGTVGGGALDMELAGAGSTKVVRSNRMSLRDLGLDQGVEDILISLETQYHLIRMCERHPDVFIYLIIDQREGTLALARRSIDNIDEQLELE